MSSHRRLSLFAFVDALGWEILQRHSFLDDLLPHRAPLGTVLGYSSTCIPTILSGSMPREHGHFSFFYYRPEASPFGVCRLLRFLPRELTRRGRVRRTLSKAIQRYYGFTGYFQIYNMPFRHLGLFDYSEKRDLYRPGGINGGQETFFDSLDRSGVPYFLSNWRGSEGSAFADAETAVSAGVVPFAYLYLADLDGIIHLHGTRSKQVTEKIAWYEAHLRRLIELARSRYDDVRVFVFSDHGQADIRECCALIPRVEATGLRFGVDYAAVYDSTMARFWFLRDGARAAIVEALGGESRGRILADAELQELGCDFPGAKFGELMFLLDPGVLLCPSFLGEKPLAAMHGYHPEDADSIAMIAASVPPDPRPARLDDIFSLVLAEAEWATGCAMGEDLATTRWHGVPS